MLHRTTSTLVSQWYSRRNSMYRSRSSSPRPSVRSSIGRSSPSTKTGSSDRDDLPLEEGLGRLKHIWEELVRCGAVALTDIFICTIETERSSLAGLSHGSADHGGYDHIQRRRPSTYSRLTARNKLDSKSPVANSQSMLLVIDSICIGL